MQNELTSPTTLLKGWGGFGADIVAAMVRLLRDGEARGKRLAGRKVDRFGEIFKEDEGDGRKNCLLNEVYILRG